MRASNHARLVPLFVGVISVSAALPARAQQPSTDNSDPSLRDYLSGNGLLNRGLYELAAEEYRKFLSEHGNHEKAPMARYGLGVALFRLKRYDDAVQQLAPLRGVKGFTYGAEVGTIVGQCHMAMQRYEPAAEAFESTVTRYGTHDLADDAAAGAAEALYLAGKFEESVARCQIVVSRWPASPLRERTEFFWGLGQMATGHYAQAADRFEAIADGGAAGPFAPRAALLAAQCRHQAGDLEKAADRYQRVIQQKASQYVAEALHGLALLLQQQGKPKEAGGFLDRLLRDYGDSMLVPSAHLQRGRAWFDLGNYDRAFESFAAIKGDDPALQDDAAYWMAKCKLRAGDYQEAAKRLKQAINRHGDSELLAEMMYDRAVALVRMEDHDAAVQALTEFRAKYPQHAMAADALHLLAAGEHQREHYDDSLKYCRLFLKDYPAHTLAPAVAFLMGENDFLSGRYEPAVETYQRFLSVFPQDPLIDKVRFRLGTSHYRLGRYDEATPLLAGLDDRGDREGVFRTGVLTVGDIHFQRGEWKQAEEELSKYLAAGLDAPSADDALLKRGLARQRQERYEEALRDYDALLKRFDKSAHRAQAVFERGQCLVAMDRLDDAVAAFDQLLSEDRDSRFAPHALNHLAAIAMKRGDFEESARRFSQVSRTADDEALKGEALYQKGQAQMAAGDYRAAEKTFAQYVDQFSSGARAAPAAANLAIAQSRLDRCEDALSAISRVEGAFRAQLTPDVLAAVGYEKAWCLRSLGRTEDAARAYRDLLAQSEAGTPNVHAMLELAELEAGRKHYEQAVEVLDRIWQYGQSQEVEVPADVREMATYRLGVSLFELEKFDRAAAVLNDFARDYPKSDLVASAAFFCGESWFKSGHHDKAAQHLTLVMDRFPQDAAFGPALLRLGECLATLQRWPKSEQVFSAYLDRFADGEHWYQARFGVGWARENQGRYQEAIEAYSAVVQRHQGPTAARSQFQIGECLFAQKKYEEAVRELLKVDILYGYPEWSAAALYEAGRCFEKLNQPDKAREQFSAVAEKYQKTQWADMASKRLAAATSAAPVPGRQ
ncbi:MAG: outer membrane protein assembly factor BamD [Phycisphaerales bacterium]|nr:MAG: outer membrane protein assembly factor BamD [Phycisphaerales bacterium]